MVKILATISLVGFSIQASATDSWRFQAVPPEARVFDSAMGAVISESTPAKISVYKISAPEHQLKTANEWREFALKQFMHRNYSITAASVDSTGDRFELTLKWDDWSAGIYTRAVFLASGKNILLFSVDGYRGPASMGAKAKEIDAVLADIAQGKNPDIERAASHYASQAF